MINFKEEIEEREDGKNIVFSKRISYNSQRPYVEMRLGIGKKVIERIKDWLKNRCDECETLLDINGKKVIPYEELPRSVVSKEIKFAEFKCTGNGNNATFKLKYDLPAVIPRDSRYEIIGEISVKASIYRGDVNEIKKSAREILDMWAAYVTNKI